MYAQMERIVNRWAWRIVRATAADPTMRPYKCLRCGKRHRTHAKASECMGGALLGYIYGY